MLFRGEATKPCGRQSSQGGNSKKPTENFAESPQKQTQNSRVHDGSCILKAKKANIAVYG